MTHLRLDLMIQPANPGLPTRADFEQGINYQATPAQLSALIPAGTPNTYVPGPRTTHGFKFEWMSAGVRWIVWGHDAVIDAPADTFAARDWTFRVRAGNQFLAPVGFGTGQGGQGVPSRWWGGQHAEKTHILLEHY